MSIKLVQLGEVTTLQAGIGFPPKLQGRKSGLFPFAKVGDISRCGRTGNSILATADHYVDQADIDLLRAKPVPVGSVLFAKIGEAIRQNHRVVAGCRMLIDNNAMAAIPGERIDGRFLYHFLKTVDFYCLAPATTVPALRKSDLERLPIPLPPLPEQRRIAAILDQADALRAKRREALEQLDSLTQSIFIEMFGDPVSNPKNWSVKPLSECAERIQIGPFGTQLHEEDYIDGGIPLINPTHLRGGVISPDSSLTVSPEKYTELSNYYLLTGDLIMGRRGEMGRCAVITNREQGWLCGTGSLFVRPKTDVLSPTYLGLVISSPSMRRFLENVAQGVTMANLNKTIVGGLPIAVPPMTMQQAFVSQLNAAQAIKNHSLNSLVELDTLFASLQHRAFRGEL